MNPRFFLDEHINPAIQRQLWRINLEIEVKELENRKCHLLELLIQKY
jgi:hypothetical protein